MNKIFNNNNNISNLNISNELEKLGKFFTLYYKL